MTVRIPNFFIAGAQKSGTSTLYRMLSRHPDIFLSGQKELNFFNQPNITDEAWADYLGNFAAAKGQRYVGEATPHYFSCDKDGPLNSTIAKRIARYAGTELKILLILRNPVERALAGWRHNYVYGRLSEGVSIFDAPSSQGVLRLSRYARNWHAWNKVFAEECFHVYLFDDLASRPKELLPSILADLGLTMDEAAYKDFPFGKRFNNIKSNMEMKEVDTTPGFDLASIEELIAYLEEDIAFVESHTNRDLSHWRDAEDIQKRINSV